VTFGRFWPLAVVLLGVLAGLCCYFVKDYEVVIVTQFGKPVRTVENAGLHFKLPGIFEKINRFDKRVDVFETPPTQLLLGDKRPIIVSCFVAWTVDTPLIFFESVGDADNAVQKISDMVNSRLSIVLGDYTNEDIINTNADAVRLPQVEKRMKEVTNQRARERYGVNIVKVGIQRLAYPSTVIEAVYDRMKSERKKEADKIKAEGAEVASRLMAKADKEAREIEAEAKKKALVIKGEGEREAMRIYAQAYGQDKEFFEFLQSLETYSNMLGKDTTLILSSDSELFKYLGISAREKH
jgi:membrane protease subunit HflC